MHETDRLDGWKAIADYLNRSVRTAHRWNQELGMPVHRLPGARGNIVYALRSEINEWVAEREGDVYDALGNGPLHGRRGLVPVSGLAVLLLVALGLAWLVGGLGGGGQPSAGGGAPGPAALLGAAGLVNANGVVVNTDNLIRHLGQVVFHSVRSGNAEIHMMNDDGSDQIQLTDHPALDLYAVFSPDGSQIAFSSDRNGGQGEVFLMDSDGSNIRQLTSGLPNALPYAEGVHWHPSGSKIVFSSCIDGTWQLFEIDTDGSNLIQLTYADNSTSWPRYSRDGTKIYAMRTTPNDETNSEIFEITHAGARQLTFTLDNRAPDEVLENGVPTLFFSKAFSNQDQRVFRLVAEPARGVKRPSRSLRSAEYPVGAHEGGFADTQAVGARGPGAALAMNQILLVTDRGESRALDFNIWRMSTDGRNAVRLTEQGGSRPDWWIPLPGETGVVAAEESGGSRR